MLVRFDVELDVDDLPLRVVFGTPDLIDWLRDTLPGIETAIASDVTPYEQVDDLLRRFIAGEALADDRFVKSLVPGERGVWELKTQDIRLFGWFPQRSVFIAVCAHRAHEIKLHRLYGGFRDQVVRVRSQLDADGAAFLTGVASDVL